MEGGQYQVAGEAGLHGYFRRFHVADLADHDDIRVLTQYGAQPMGKGEVDLGIYLDLSHPFQLVFHRSSMVMMFFSGELTRFNAA